MDYTSIHIYGHLLSDDILHGVEHDTNLLGNRQQDFDLDISTSVAIDYVWSTCAMTGGSSMSVPG